MPRDRYDDDRDDRRDDDHDRPRRRRYHDDPPLSGGGGKTVLIVLAIVGGVLLLCGGVGGVGLYFAINRTRDAAARMQATNNGKQLTIGLHNYHDAHNRFPGPHVDDTDRGVFGGGAPPSNPADRLSWRYTILPFIEQDSLYRSMDPGQAWNKGMNAGPSGTYVMTYGDPRDERDANTRFRCFYNNGALFDTDPKKRVSFSGITDGSSYTIMFVETAERVPWAQFNELPFDPNGSPPALGHPNRDTVIVGMADGSVRSIRKTVDPASLKAAITRSANDTPGPDFD